MELSGKHALVTGGGTGIGLAIAQALRGAGAEVTITGRREEVLKGAGPGFHPLVMDVRDEASVRGGIKAAAEARGAVDICVINAGIAEGGRFGETTLEDWRRVLSTNLDGAFLTAQAALETLEPDAWGRMIFVSSIAGVRGLRGAIPYTASKHGMVGLMRGLSEEYLRSDITFNALCPGYVETDIVTQQVPLVAKRDGISEDNARERLARGNRHNTLLQADEIAAAALWLCQSGSGSVNGQTIQIAGGQVS
jgi:NAD(P)-dependent dehydrogenase (short-subunit alcohol dehydrogenase family)